MNLKEFKNTLTSGNYDDIKPFLRMEVRNKANLGPDAYYNDIIGDIVSVVAFQTLLDDNSQVSAVATNNLINTLDSSVLELLNDARLNTPCNFKLDRLYDIAINARREGKLISAQYPLDSIESLLTSDDLLECTLVVSIDAITRVSILQFPKLLRYIYGKIGDYYIVPSSVYEQMIIPADKVDDIDGVKQIIHQVNSTVVKPTDMLSDKLLKYNALGLSEC